MRRFNVLDVEQRSAEWHDLRSRSIGASDVPKLMGVSRYATPFQLWARKLGLIPEQVQNAAMARGVAMEGEALAWYEEQLGVKCSGLVAQHLDLKWAIASLDGWNELLNCPVEIKCSSGADFALVLDGKIPEEFYPQLQWQMYVTGASMSHLVIYDGTDGVVTTCEVNKDYQERMEREADKFHHAMVMMEAPKFTERDTYERSDFAWLKLAKDIGEAKEALEVAQDRVDALKAMSVALAEMEPFHRQEGGGMKLTLVCRQGVVDYKAIPELSGVDLNKYRKAPSQSWTLTTK